MDQLIKRLGCLPLALVQAGKYMRESGTSCLKYLELYESSWVRLVAEVPQLRDYENGSIQTTWTISYRRVEHANPTAARLLQLWAYLDHQDIWYEMFSRGSRGCQDCRWLQDLGSSEIEFKRTMSALLAYSLVESRQDMESYSVHPVVHDWCAETISDNRVEFLMLAFLVFGFAVPSNAEREYWLSQQRLIPHAEHCMWQSHHIEIGDVTDYSESNDAFHNLGLLYADQGKLGEAEEMYQRALDGKEKVWGAERTSTLDTVNNLGALYADQCKLAEAEKMYQPIR